MRRAALDAVAGIVVQSSVFEKIRNVSLAFVPLSTNRSPTAVLAPPSTVSRPLVTVLPLVVTE